MSEFMEPAQLAQYDQRVAGIRDLLHRCVDEHRKDIVEHGETDSIVGLALGTHIAIGVDPATIVDMLAVAVNELAKAGE